MAEQFATATVQWGVGQGGFNSQFVYASGERGWRTVAHVIYDCGGSRNLVEGAIQADIELLKSTGGQRVDAIFISHVDADHVGGVKTLLEELRKANIAVGDVYLTHLNLPEKLAVVLEANNNSSPDASDSLDSTGDTIRAEDLWDVPGLLQEINSDVTVIELPASDIRPGDDPEGIAVREAGDILVEADRRRGRAWARKTVYSSPVAGEIFWEWLPMVDERSSKQSDTICKAIESNPKIRITDVAALTAEDLKQVLLDDTRRKALITELKKGKILRTDPSVDSSFSNISSIILYAGPPATSNVGDHEIIAQIVSVGWQSAGIYDAPWSDISKRELPLGWLGTGDAELKLNKSLEDLLEFVGDRNGHIGVLSSPHHGGKKNSSYKFPQSFEGAQAVTFEYGSNNGYGHPSSLAIGACYRAGKIPVHLSETGGWIFQMFKF